MLKVQFIHTVGDLPYIIHGAWMTEQSYICGNLEYVPEGVDVDNYIVIARPSKSQEDDKLGLIFQHGASPNVAHQIVLRWMQQNRSTGETGSAANIDTASWQELETRGIDTNGVITGLILSPDLEYLYVNCRPFQGCPRDISEMTLTCYSLATYEKINVHVGHQAFTGSEACVFIFPSVANKQGAR